MKLGGSYCTHYKPYVTYQLLLVWEAVQEDVRDGRGGGKEWRMEEQGVATETGREEKLLNDETICTVKWLDQTSTNGRTSSMATSSVTKKKAAISLNTPIFFFSLLFSLTTLVYPQLQSSMYLSLGILVKTKTTHTDTQRAASWVTYSLNNTAQLQTQQTHRETPA